MAEVQSELLNFIIDLDDGDCPDVSLHVAAFQGKTDMLKLQLQASNVAQLLNSRVRPFLASPLRLAATGTCCELFVSLCLFFLLFRASPFCSVVSGTFHTRKTFHQWSLLPVSASLPFFSGTCGMYEAPPVSRRAR